MLTQEIPEANKVVHDESDIEKDYKSCDLSYSRQDGIWEGVRDDTWLPERVTRYYFLANTHSIACHDGVSASFLSLLTPLSHIVIHSTTG